MSFYWANTDKPRRPRPPDLKPSPEYVAYHNRMTEAAKACEAADDGLACCPKCGRTKGVRLTKAPRSIYKSGRHHGGECPCGYYGPVRYGMQAARDAWNAIDRSHLPTSTS